jgi:uncharacterized protein YbaP (TraB family)
MREDGYPLNKTIESAYHDTQTLVLEINLDEASSSKAQSLMLSKGQYPVGQTLRESMSPKTFELIKKKTEELGLDIQQVNRLKPWLVTITLAAMQLEQLGYDSTLELTSISLIRPSRQERNSQPGIHRISSELIGRHVSGNQEAALLETIQELDLFKKEFEDIIKAWSGGESMRLNGLLLIASKTILNSSIN